MATVTVDSFASKYKVVSGDVLAFSTILGGLKGLEFWFEDSGVQVGFPKWSSETGEGSFLRITTNPGAPEQAEFLYPICQGANYISFEQFDTSGKIAFVYDQAALLELTVAPMRLLPPLPPLPGVSPLLPPLPPLK